MGKLKDLYQKIPSIYTNRYIITAIIFLVWISFFDAYNFVYHAKLMNKKKEYQQELQELKNETIKNKKFIEKLQHPYFAEKYAREKFLMKKEGEDIFIVE